MKGTREEAEMKSSIRLKLWALLPIAIWLFVYSNVVIGAESAGTEQVARSTAGLQSERADNPRHDETKLKEFKAGTAEGTTKQSLPAELQKHLDYCCDYQIYDARTRLFDDFDGDGRYTYLRTRFDLATNYAASDVFVRLFMRRRGGLWLMVFESDVFTVFSGFSLDNYEIETELVSGFPPDDYDVLLEVYEAPFDNIVLQYGPSETSAFSYLPMEDISFDNVLTKPIAVSSGGGGAMSIELLFLVFLAGLRLIATRREWVIARC